MAGGAGYFAILLFSVCENVGIACVYVLFLWNSLYYLLCRFQLYGLNGFVGTITSAGSGDDSLMWSMTQISQRDAAIIIGFSVLSILPSILILRVSSMHWLRYAQLLSVTVMALVQSISLTLSYLSYVRSLCGNQSSFDLDSI